MVKKSKLVHVLWVLYAAVVIPAVYVWGNSLNWNFENLSLYNIFPLFGLLAFSLMWVHYVSGVVRDYFFPGESTRKSFITTSYFVFSFILLHPTLLVLQLWSDGKGLPPGSYKAYNSLYAPFITLGLFALVGFLIFETKRWFSKKKWWQYVEVINDAAVVLIMFHSLRLGQHLQQGWFRGVWYFYIVTIGLCIVRTYYKKLMQG
jgi:phage-related holin